MLQVHDRKAQALQLKDQRGFTLIELLVSMTMSIMLVGAAVGLFFITLRSDSKKTSVAELRDNGDYAMNQMEFLLRNAIQLDKATPTSLTCAPGMTQIVLKSIDNGLTHLFVQSGRIASRSVTTGTVRYLSGVSTTVSNLAFDCSQVLENQGTRIKVRFQMDYAPQSGLYVENGTQDFETTVNIRSL